MIVEGRYELYNIDSIISTENGQQICRVPADVREGLLPGAYNTASLSSTGCELRFVMNEGCDSVTLHLHCLEPFMLLQLYFGSFQGGWKYLHIRGLFPGDNTLVIERPANIQQLRETARERGHLFSPDVMRLCFRSGCISDIRLEGDVRPPRSNEVPEKRILFYGSSITHGSLSYLPCNDYASLVCRKLGADLINKGCAGSCRMEKSMVDYLVGRNDYEFCVFELGSNIPADLSAQEFKQNVHYLLDSYTAAHPDKKAYVIDDLIVLSPDHRQRHEQVRECLQEIANPNLIYVDGYQMLPDADLVCADFVHPTVEGHQVMAHYLLNVISNHPPV